eukprot:g533.t1
MNKIHHLLSEFESGVGKFDDDDDDDDVCKDMKSSSEETTKKNSTIDIVMKKVRKLHEEKEMDEIESRMKFTKLSGKTRRKRVRRILVTNPYQKRPLFRKGEVVHIVENHIKVRRGTIVKVPKHGRWVSIYCEEDTELIKRVDVNKLVSDVHLNIFKN